MSDSHSDKKNLNIKSPSLKGEQAISGPQQENLKNKAESNKKTKQDEFKEELTQDNLAAIKDDLVVGDRSNQQIKKRKEYSKYDFIKVRVTLGEHFYVLSRFLVSRMLTLCKVKNI